MKVAFQGVKGAYSEVALREYFGKQVTPIGHAQSQEVLQAVINEDVNFGILPIENSIVGSVVVNLDLFYQHPVTVLAESYLKIEHALLAVKDAKLDDIDYVYSHPVALDQCQDFLKKHNIQPITTYDTAGAAKMIAEKKTTHEAAICNTLCENYYDLNALATNIQNVADNFTRFFIFAKDGANTSSLPSTGKNDKTTIAFQTKHHPGALVNCLNQFSSQFINLTKIESRPIPHNPFEYIFYVDFQGSSDSDLIQDILVNLKSDAKVLKIIGSYHRGSRS